MSDISREEMNANLAKVSAETDTKFARFEGKLEHIVKTLEHTAEHTAKSLADMKSELKADGRATRATAWVIGGLLAALIVAIAGLYPAFFDMGFEVRGAIQQEIRAALPAPPQPQAP